MPNRPTKKKEDNIKLVPPPTKEEKDAFLKEYEALVTPLYEKHKLCLVPVIANMSTQFKIHQEAVFAIDVYKSPQSKTNEPTDSNN